MIPVYPKYTNQDWHTLFTPTPSRVVRLPKSPGLNNRHYEDYLICLYAQQTNTPIRRFNMNNNTDKLSLPAIEEYFTKLVLLLKPCIVVFNFNDDIDSALMVFRVLQKTGINELMQIIFFFDRSFSKEFDHVYSSTANTNIDFSYPPLSWLNQHWPRITRKEMEISQLGDPTLFYDPEGNPLFGDEESYLLWLYPSKQEILQTFETPLTTFFEGKIPESQNKQFLWKKCDQRVLNQIIEMPLLGNRGVLSCYDFCILYCAKNNSTLVEVKFPSLISSQLSYIHSDFKTFLFSIQTKALVIFRFADNSHISKFLSSLFDMFETQKIWETLSLMKFAFLFPLDSSYFKKFTPNSKNFGIESHPWYKEDIQKEVKESLKTLKNEKRYLLTTSLQTSNPQKSTLEILDMKQDKVLLQEQKQKEITKTTEEPASTMTPSSFNNVQQIIQKKPKEEIEKLLRALFSSFETQDTPESHLIQFPYFAGKDFFKASYLCFLFALTSKISCLHIVLDNSRFSMQKFKDWTQSFQKTKIQEKEKKIVIITVPKLNPKNSRSFNQAIQKMLPLFPGTDICIAILPNKYPTEETVSAGKFLKPEETKQIQEITKKVQKSEMNRLRDELVEAQKFTQINMTKPEPESESESELDEKEKNPDSHVEKSKELKSETKLCQIPLPEMPDKEKETLITNLETSKEKSPKKIRVGQTMESALVPYDCSSNNQIMTTKTDQIRNKMLTELLKIKGQKFNLAPEIGKSESTYDIRLVNEAIKQFASSAKGVLCHRPVSENFVEKIPEHQWSLRQKESGQPIYYFNYFHIVTQDVSKFEEAMKSMKEEMEEKIQKMREEFTDIRKTKKRKKLRDGDEDEPNWILEKLAWQYVPGGIKRAQIEKVTKRLLKGVTNIKLDAILNRKQPAYQLSWKRPGISQLQKSQFSKKKVDSEEFCNRIVAIFKNKK
jgi:hypothetical protein